MSWSLSQQQQLAIWPKVTGFLSMIGSGSIIYEVVKDGKKRGKVYHRIMLAMSVSDLFASFWFFLSTWPIPAGTPNVAYASGTQASCTAQGFFVQYSIATPLYNVALAIYYVLVVRCGWKEDHFTRRSNTNKAMRSSLPTKARFCFLLRCPSSIVTEHIFHAVPLVFASVTSLASLGLGQYNNANLWCWIASVPLSCSGSKRNNGINDCERGNNAWIYRWAFFYVPLWTTIVVAMVAMCLTYDKVSRTEKASSKWKEPEHQFKQNSATTTSQNNEASIYKNRSTNNKPGKHSARVRAQAFYYLLAFYLSWTPATMTRLIQTINGNTYFALILLMAIFTPLQGFLNYLVYLRPRMLTYQKEHPKWSYLHILKNAVRKTYRLRESPSGMENPPTNTPGVPSSAYFQRQETTLSQQPDQERYSSIDDEEECKEEEMLMLDLEVTREGGGLLSRNLDALQQHPSAAEAQPSSDDTMRASNCWNRVSMTTENSAFSSGSLSQPPTDSYPNPQTFQDLVVLEKEVEEDVCSDGEEMNGHVDHFATQQTYALEPEPNPNPDVRDEDQPASSLSKSTDAKLEARPSPNEEGRIEDEEGIQMA